MLAHPVKEVGVYLGKANTGKTTLLLSIKQVPGKDFAIKAPENYFASGGRDAQRTITLPRLTANGYGILRSCPNRRTYYRGQWQIEINIPGSNS